MASHVFTLLDIVPSGEFTAGAVFYGAGLTYKYPLLARVTRGAPGNESIVKIQGAALPVNTCAFATRGPAGEQGELRVAALSGDFYEVLMTQRVGASLATTHTFASNLLTINLGTDGASGPAGTVSGIAEYINTNLPSDFLATSSGSSAGRLGATTIARPCARAHWTDVVSTKGGLLPAAVEQTIDAGAGNTVDVGLEINVRNYYAIRALARVEEADPPADNRVLIMLTEEGA
jgi:hypothetical protein